jgi:hypothetical protein
VCVSVLSAPGCEELLPPRTDPQNYLQMSFSGADGNVVLLEDLSMLSVVPGGFSVGVKNLHDEVLQAEEDIDISIGFHITASPSLGGSAHGDRNQLLSFRMLQHDLLTIEPESTALFFIQWDHAAYRLWEYPALVFHESPGNPVNIYWFDCEPIHITATGTAKFFENVAAVDLPETTFSISYQIFVSEPVPAVVDSFRAGYRPTGNTVLLTWQTPFESNNYGFKVEKGIDGENYGLIDDIRIPGKAMFSDTTYYTYVDSIGVTQGTWYYRLRRWYDYGFTIHETEPTESVQVHIP